MEYYSAVRKSEILPDVTIWIELEGIMLSEIIRESLMPYDLMYVWNL